MAPSPGDLCCFHMDTNDLQPPSHGYEASEPCPGKLEQIIDLTLLPEQPARSTMTMQVSNVEPFGLAVVREDSFAGCGVFMV